MNSRTTLMPMLHNLFILSKSSGVLSHIIWPEYFGQCLFKSMAVILACQKYPSRLFMGKTRRCCRSNEWNWSRELVVATLMKLSESILLFLDWSAGQYRKYQILLHLFSMLCNVTICISCLHQTAKSLRYTTGAYGVSICKWLAFMGIKSSKLLNSVVLQQCNMSLAFFTNP
jgi:hypothetical protein